uniref:exodeoxyribonuclease III n=1 Tax=Micrurus lemniscatus lemniscatus TaxID=129467 RepID=A0A2D4J5X9_MICLE
MDNNLKILSVNINGLTSPAKRNQTLKKLTKQKMDIICLQEVHVRAQDERFLQYKKLGKLYTALAEGKKRGVVVYVRDGVEAEMLYMDSVGRTLILKVVWEQKILLVVIYAPNKKQDIYYKKMT